MSYDPRDLDERGLLLQILLSLQSVENTLQTIAELRSKITDDSAPVEEKEEEPIRTWRLGLKYPTTPEGFLATNSKVHQIVATYPDMITGDWTVVYAGQRINDAEEVEPGLS